MADSGKSFPVTQCFPANIAGIMEMEEHNFRATTNTSDRSEHSQPDDIKKKDRPDEEKNTPKITEDEQQYLALSESNITDMQIHGRQRQRRGLYENGKLQKQKRISPEKKKDHWLCLVCNERFRGSIELLHHYMDHSVNILARTLLLYSRLENTSSPHPTDDWDETDEDKNDDDNYEVQVKDEIEIKEELTDFKENSPVRKYNRKKPKTGSGSKGLGSRDPHPCNICGKVLSNRGNLSKHLITHNDAKPWSCEDCGLGFNAKRDYRHHRMQKHTMERPHKCSLCGRGFVHKQYLSEHMKYHAEEKLYVCEICGRSYLTDGCLKKHQKRHTSDKSFQCQQCPKSFTVRYDLLAHVRGVHDGVKKSFANKSVKKKSNMIVAENRAVVPNQVQLPSLQETQTFTAEGGTAVMFSYEGTPATVQFPVSYEITTPVPPDGGGLCAQVDHHEQFTMQPQHVVHYTGGC